MLHVPHSDKELGLNRVFSVSSNWFNLLSLKGSQMLLTDGEDLLHSSGLRPCSAFHTATLLCLCYTVSSSHAYFRKRNRAMSWRCDTVVVTEQAGDHPRN